jgi:hypothetical protein
MVFVGGVWRTQMWKPTELGTEIAKRDLTLRIRGRKHRVVLRVGLPVRNPASRVRDPWFCPLRFGGLGPKGKLYSVAGEDSLQALVLALDFARQMMPHYARVAGGTLTWVDKDRDVVSPQRTLAEAYAKVATEAVSVIRDSERTLRRINDPRLRPTQARLAALPKKYDRPNARQRRK